MREHWIDIRLIHTNVRLFSESISQGCVLAPALFCRAMDFITEHDSRKVGNQVGQHTFTDIDYADDVALLVDKEESFRAALVSTDE